MPNLLRYAIGTVLLILPSIQVRGQDEDTKYTEGGTFKERMDKARETPVIENTNEKGGLFLGASTGIGQTFSTESHSDAGIGLLVYPEIGYAVQNSSWNRWEASMAGIMGVMQYREPKGNATVSVGFGLMPKFGIATSLGNGMLGVFRFGLGMALSKLTLKDGAISRVSNSAWGIATMLGYDVVYPVTQHFEVVGGLALTHFNFNYSSVTYADAPADTKFDAKSIATNVPALELGLRLKF